jgi:predicted porin
MEKLRDVPHNGACKTFKSSISRAAVLALFGLPACGIASAQSDVKVSGAIDTGIAYFRTDSTSLWKLASGSIAASSLSFSGSEDLGNGNKAFFVVRDLFVSSTGEMSGGKLFGSEAKVGLSGSYGIVELGRLFNPTHQLMVFRSPSVSNFAGAFNMAIGGAGYTPYWDNAVRYTSPKFLSFTATAQHTRNILNAESAAPNEKNGVGTAVGLQYLKGPLDLITVYEQTKAQTRPQTDYDARRASISAVYNFGFAKLHGTYHKESYKGVGAPLDFDMKIVGTSVPLADKLHASAEFGYKTFKGSPNAAAFTGLGLFYNLSVRTVLYSEVVLLKNHGSNRQSIYRGPVLQAGENVSGYTVGIRHSF